MSAIAAANRRRLVTWMAIAAGVAALLAAVSFLPPPRPPVRVEVGEKVLPDFAASADKVQLVMVTTSQEAYHLVRNGDAAKPEWVLAEKGSYPVDPERIAELNRALSAIAYARPMTRDERSSIASALAIPQRAAQARLLEVGDGSGTSFAKLLVGYRDGTYLCADAGRPAGLGGRWRSPAAAAARRTLARSRCGRCRASADCRCAGASRAGPILSPDRIRTRPASNSALAPPHASRRPVAGLRLRHGRAGAGAVLRRSMSPAPIRSRQARRWPSTSRARARASP